MIAISLVLRRGSAVSRRAGVRISSPCSYLRGDATPCHRGAPESTYHHQSLRHFTHFTAVRNCHGACCNDTPGERLDRHRGGGLQVSRHHASVTIPARDGSVSAQGRFSRIGLGTGGATSSVRQGPGDGGTAKYLFVGTCLSFQRAGAAGSERALPPGVCSIALERELEQRPAAQLAQQSAFLGCPSEHPYSRSGQTCRTVGATPDRFGTRGGASAARRRRPGPFRPRVSALSEVGP